MTEAEKLSWQQEEWTSPLWGTGEIRTFLRERNEKKHLHKSLEQQAIFISILPVMLLSPSSLKDKTIEVGLASPGATHFFLVRWCFPGCPTNFIPFGTEIFTWTCENFWMLFIATSRRKTNQYLWKSSKSQNTLKKPNIVCRYCLPSFWKHIWLTALLSAQQYYK